MEIGRENSHPGFGGFQTFALIFREEKVKNESHYLT